MNAENNTERERERGVRERGSERGEEGMGRTEKGGREKEGEAEEKERERGDRGQCTHQLLLRIIHFLDMEEIIVPVETLTQLCVLCYTYSLLHLNSGGSFI